MSEFEMKEVPIIDGKNATYNGLQFWLMVDNDYGFNKYSDEEFIEKYDNTYTYSSMILYHDKAWTKAFNNKEIELVIPDNIDGTPVTTITEHLFGGLKSIEIPASVTNICIGGLERLFNQNVEIKIHPDNPVYKMVNGGLVIQLPDVDLKNHVKRFRNRKKDYVYTAWEFFPEQKLADGKLTIAISETATDIDSQWLKELVKKNIKIEVNPNNPAYQTIIDSLKQDDSKKEAPKENEDAKLLRSMLAQCKGLDIPLREISYKIVDGRATIKLSDIHLEICMESYKKNKAQSPVSSSTKPYKFADGSLTIVISEKAKKIDGDWLRAILAQNINVEIDPRNPKYKYIDGNLYADDGKILFQAVKDVPIFIIPDGVKEIAPNAFGGMCNIESIVIPSSLHVFGKPAFPYGEGEKKFKSIFYKGPRVKWKQGINLDLYPSSYFKKDVTVYYDDSWQYAADGTPKITKPKGFFAKLLGL